MSHDTLIGDGSITFTKQEELDMVREMRTKMRQQLLNSYILDRVLERKKLAGKLTTGDLNLDGQNRSTISQVKASLLHVNAIHDQLVDEIGTGE
jgi:D-alanyl-D-alanine carboxypeptidase